MLNDNSILPRHLSARLLEALTYSRVVNIIGPRQAGTTTLVRDILNMGKFITLDDQNTLSAIEDDPSRQLESLLEGQLAEMMGVSRKTVNELCTNRRAITADTALMLATVFGNSAEFWLNLQQRNEIWKALNTTKRRSRIEKAKPIAA